MTIGSRLRAPPSTLGSRAKSKTPEGTPPSSKKRKEKANTSKKCKVAFEDVPKNSPPPQPTKAASQPEPSDEEPTSSSGGPSQADKDEEFLALLRQLPEKAGLSVAFIDRFTSEESWERMKPRPAKIAFSAAMRMFANTAATAILMYDPVLECMEKDEKIGEIAQTCEDLKKTREDEKRSFESEKQQLQESLAQEKLEKQRLEEENKELKKTISQYPDALKEATKEASRKAVEEFKATEGKELEEKASDIASSTIIYNIYCEHPGFDFSFLGEDVVELVESWKESEAAEASKAGGDAPIE